jgi:hypothetical protein
MVRLELSDEEANELGSVLEAERHRLLLEVSAADSRDFKHDLKDRLERLERIQSRLAYICSLESTDEEGWIPTG